MRRWIGLGLVMSLVAMGWGAMGWGAMGCMSHSAAASPDDEVARETPERVVDEEPIEREALIAASGHSHDGATIYERVCVTCHGKTGDGTGLEQKLFGFDAPVEEWTYGPSVEGIMTALNEGIHETSMKPFPEYGEAERRAVAKYVLELRETLLESSPESE